MKAPYYLVLVTALSSTGYADKLVFNDSSAGQSPLVAHSPVTLAWDPATTGPAAEGFRISLNQHPLPNLGNVTQYTMPLDPGPYHATVAAYIGTQFSEESVPLDFTVETQTVPPDCTSHPVTIQVKSYDNTVQVGNRGTVLFDLTNPFPITQIQVRMTDQLANQLIGGQFSGTDLRDAAGIKFNVPRVVGTYQLGVWAVDSSGCQGVTTAVRTVNVTANPAAAPAAR